jgi:hypothetical protein
MVSPAGNVSVTASNVPGITLIPFPSPEVSSFLAPLPSIPLSLQTVLPYSILIRNATSKPIFAYTVSWISRDRDGAQHSDYRTVCAAMTYNGVIASGQDSLVTIAGSIGAPTHAASQTFEDSQEEISRFQNQASVVIALEAVMFADGVVFGKDTSGSVAQIKARIRSEYDLYSSVAAGATTGSALVSWLQTLSGQVKPGMNLKTLSGDPLIQWYRFYQAKIAANLLQVAGTNKDESAIAAEIIAYATSTLKVKHYPPLALKN